MPTLLYKYLWNRPVKIFTLKMFRSRSLVHVTSFHLYYLFRTFMKCSDDYDYVSLRDTRLVFKYFFISTHYSNDCCTEFRSFDVKSGNERGFPLRTFFTLASSISVPVFAFVCNLFVHFGQFDYFDVISKASTFRFLNITSKIFFSKLIN